MKEKIIIYGIGKFPQLLSIYLQDKFDIVGYTVEKEYLSQNQFLEKPVIAFEDIEKEYNPKEFSCFVAIGYSYINKLRERIVKEVKAKKYNLVSYVHPSSIIAKDVEIKENTFIFENVTIQPFTKLEENLIIWSNATICHDTIIEKNCFIGANSCINGFVKIGQNSFIGANSTIRNNISIGKFNIIGAGCTILENTENNKVYKSKNPILLDINSEKINI